MVRSGSRLCQALKDQVNVRTNSSVELVALMVQTCESVSCSYEIPTLAKLGFLSSIHHVTYQSLLAIER